MPRGVRLKDLSSGVLSAYRRALGKTFIVMNTEKLFGFTGLVVGRALVESCTGTVYPTRCSIAM